MKKLLLLFYCLCCSCVFSQEKVELTPNGFQTLTVVLPNIPLENLIEASRSWASSYNKNGADVYEVTTNSLKIDALRKGAFYYYSLGERYSFDVKYTMAVEFSDKNYTLKLMVKEIYTDDKLIESTLTDYFTPDGTLKEGFEEIKPSIENTVNKILNSYINYIQR